MPKNIVLLSDGTGNSSAQLLKTNVWRVYEALQLTDPSRQVACYDDGVGTSSFKPLRLLGGAMGVGLRQNVLRLYRFLCEHYDPGDRIFMFGFSRGAFTVRVLNALICSQGIIKTRPTLPVAGATVMGPSNEASDGGGVAAVAPPANTGHFAYGSELVRLSRWAYREFRKDFNQTGSLVTAARWLRDVLFRGREAVWRLAPYDPALNHQVDEVAFIGVWDTVDAYGLPIDELTAGIDQWVWPLSMPELGLNPKVKRACHVLALDDERNTFHPVLWDEIGSGQRQDHTHINDERITQVWFAGMHSNVGGGYPDDALSSVSLAWMTKQVERDLIFVPHLLKHHVDKADPLGRLYDSRSGLKGYYRYNPRKIEPLTNNSSVKIPRPKIHESVFTRISAAPEAYAPIVFPPTYGVVMEDGRILDGANNPFEVPAAALKRAEAQEAAWDLVWRKRVAYFASVGVTLVLLARPFLDGAEAARAMPDAGTASRIVAMAGEWLPSSASPWITYFTARPWELIRGVAILLLLSYIAVTLQAKICRTMRGIWLEVIPPAINQYQKLQPTTTLLSIVRRSRLYRGLFAFWSRTVLPNAFGVVTLLCLVAAANRVAFEAVNVLGGFCVGSSAVTPLAPLATQPVTLVSQRFCTGTGIRLEAGKHYQFRVAAIPSATDPWKDGGVDVTYAAGGFTAMTPGLTTLQRAILVVSGPFRRLWSANWFVPVARVGEGGLDQYRLDADTMNITAKTTGELFLFVNDAIWPINSFNPAAWGWRAFYRNNTGAATVTVQRLPDAR